MAGPSPLLTPPVAEMAGTPYSAIANDLGVDVAEPPNLGLGSAALARYASSSEGWATSRPGTVSPAAVSTDTEHMEADDGKATECYDWQNWERKRFFGLRKHHKHEEKYDGDQIMSQGWRKHSVVRRQGPIHYWWEDGLAENSHYPCEDGTE